jgi:hypothetical protein
MSETKAAGGIKNHAGGWITERQGTDVPGFLKATYIVVALVCMGYLILYMNGETGHDTRGPLVQQLNAVTGQADTFIYIVVALVLCFAIGLFVVAFGNVHED